MASTSNKHKRSQKKKKVGKEKEARKDKKDEKENKVKAVLVVRNVYKKFGRKTVLRNISFKINEGDIFSIIGVSGAGKTVLLKTIVNFFRPSAGRILYKGKPVTKRRARRVFGFSVQEGSFYPELTVRENIAHFGRLYGMSNKEIRSRTRELLKLLELNNCGNKLTAHLSGGMQKRLDIACALVHKPKLLLLDEPTTELDVLLKRDVLKLIRSINKKGVTVIIVSLPLEVESISNKLALIDDGKLIKKDLSKKLRIIYRDHAIAIFKKFKQYK